MKKNAKRLLGLLIVLAMMVSLVGTMALADSTAAAKEPVVTYIGTSVSSGFFLPQDKDGWNDADWSKIVEEWTGEDFGGSADDVHMAYHPYDALAPGSAPRLVAEGLGMKVEAKVNRNDNFHKLCLTGLRTSELLRFMYGKGSAWDQKMSKDWLSEEYMNGHYSGFETNEAGVSEADYFYDNTIDWIEKSDYVIVEIGANDVMTTVIDNLFNPDNGYLTNYKSALKTEETYKAMLELAAKTGDLSTVVVKALSLAKSAGELPLMMTAMTKALMEGTMMFYTNYGKVIKEIYRHNPDVTVLALGTFNPLRNVKVADGLPLDASLLMDPNIRMMNTYIKTLAPYALSWRYDYRFVDNYNVPIYGIDNTLLGMLTSPNLKDFDATKTGPIHPNAEGHKYMANQILKAIDK